MIGLSCMESASSPLGYIWPWNSGHAPPTIELGVLAARLAVAEPSARANARPACLTDCFFLWPTRLRRPARCVLAMMRSMACPRLAGQYAVHDLSPHRPPIV
jgi:hypothetical protein